MITAQEAADEAETVGLYSQQRVLKGAAAAAEIDYYKSKLATLTSVDELIGDAKLFSVALEAYGLDPSIASESAIRSVLVSDLSDPASPANAFNDQRYVKLRKAFSLAADGSAPAGGAQTSATTHRDDRSVLRRDGQRQLARRGGVSGPKRSSRS